MNVAQLFFSFTGRINRAKYWAAILVFIIIALISLTVAYVGEETPALHVLGFVIDVALLIAGIAVGVCAFHRREALSPHHSAIAWGRASGQAMNILHVLFGFSGRINRAKFWLAALIYFVVIGVATAVAFTFESFDWVTVAMVIILVVLISSVAVGIKRLHDRDKSAWWLAFFYLAPAALSAIGYHLLGGSDPDGGGILEEVLGFASLAINIWMLVELGCLRGTIGGNQFGPDPVAPQPTPRPLR